MFLLGDPPGTTLGAGLAFYAGALTATPGYEWYHQGDSPARNFYSLSLSYDF